MKAIATTLALLAALIAGDAQAGSVIVRADSEVDKLDIEAVRRIFMGREAVLDGTTVQVIYQKGGALRADFDSKVLQKSGPDLAAYWSKLIFTGRAKAPQELDGDEAVKAKVAASPGAIGYVGGNVADPSLKVVHTF